MKQNWIIAGMIGCLMLPVHGQAPPVGAPANGGVAVPQGPPRLRVLMIHEDGRSVTAFLVGASKSHVRIYESEQAEATVDKRVSDFSSIYIYEPKEFLEGKRYYQAKNYKEAQERFALVKDKYKFAAALEDNPSTMAGYYEMECARRTGNLNQLSELSSKFSKDALTHETKLKQIELYVLWETVRDKAWDRVLALTKQFEGGRIPLDQRVQVSYCQGLANENTKQVGQALLDYQVVMTADVGESDELARQAALNTLKILMADEEVGKAMKVWKTDKEVKSSRGYQLLNTAVGVVKMYEVSFGVGYPLPNDYRALIKMAHEIR